MLGLGRGQTKAYSLQDLNDSKAITDLWYMKNLYWALGSASFSGYFDWLSCADVRAYSPVEPAIKPTVIACSRGLFISHSTQQLCMPYMTSARVRAMHHRSMPELVMPA